MQQIDRTYHTRHLAQHRRHLVTFSKGIWSLLARIPWVLILGKLPGDARSGATAAARMPAAGEFFFRRCQFFELQCKNCTVFIQKNLFFLQCIFIFHVRAYQSIFFCFFLADLRRAKDRPKSIKKTGFQYNKFPKSDVKNSKTSENDVLTGQFIYLKSPKFSDEKQKSFLF